MKILEVAAHGVDGPDDPVQTAVCGAWFAWSEGRPGIMASASSVRRLRAYLGASIRHARLSLATRRTWEICVDPFEIDATAGAATQVSRRREAAGEAHRILEEVRDQVSSRVSVALDVALGRASMDDYRVVAGCRAQRTAQRRYSRDLGLIGRLVRRQISPET
ncbi:MAG: hypothetical protein ACF8XB_13795 [Planctomycetota bacterium JB042]